MITGNDRGKTGKVLQVFPKDQRLVVEEINLMTKQLPKRGDRPGQKISFSGPVAVSNVQLVSVKTGARGRVGYKYIDHDGKKIKVRIIRSKGQQEDVE